MRKYLQSFGRTKSRKLRDNAKHLLAETLPKMRIDKFPQFEFKPKEVWLEIGFGDGGHLLHQALNHRDIGFIGCEPFINGTAKLLRGIEENKLNNIKIFTSDFRLLTENFPKDSIDCVFVLFPDPWPKTRHNKRRLITDETLDILTAIMKKGANLRLATDHPDYAKWIIIRLLNRSDFRWQAQSKTDWQNPRADHFATKYQKKASLTGRKPIFLEFAKI